jgi:hypothetical protein
MNRIYMIELDGARSSEAGILYVRPVFDFSILASGFFLVLALPLC